MLTVLFYFISFLFTYPFGTDVVVQIIGKSARTFKERYKEHLKAPSPIFNHNNATGNTTSVENFQYYRKGDMVWTEPSKKPFTSESTTLPSTETLANTTCHIFGTRFCFPSQNWKLNEEPLHHNISALRWMLIVCLIFWYEVMMFVYFTDVNCLFYFISFHFILLHFIFIHLSFWHRCCCASYYC